MRIGRIKHTRQELRAIRTLDHAMTHVPSGSDAYDILLSALLTLKYEYSSNREHTMIQTLAVWGMTND